MKKSTKIIIAVVSVLLVAAIVFAVLYFATDIFKTKNPKKAFYEYLDKAAASEKDFSYSDMIAKLKETQDKSYEGKGKVSMDVELGSRLKSEDYANIIDVLNNAEISFESKTDPKSSQGYTSMNIKYDGKDLGTLQVIADDEKIGVKIDEITDKYITITFEELMENLNLNSSSFDISSLTESNIDTDELVDLLNVSDDEINRIKDRYKKVLEDSIPEDCYSSEKEKITVNGKEINATAYSVKVSEKDAVGLLVKMLESLKEDDDTIDLVIEKVNKLMELSGESSMKLTKSNVKYFIESALSGLQDTSEFSDEKLTISIYEYKDQTVRVRFAFNDDAITVDSLEDGDTTNMEFKIKMQGTEMTLLKVEQTKKGENAYTTTLSMDIQGIKFELTLDTDSTDSSEKDNMKMYIEIPNMIKATINVESELSYTSVSIDKLSSSNSVSYKDIDSNELAYNLLDYVDEHMDAIKDIAKKLGYEDEIEEFENQLNRMKAGTTQTNSTTLDENNEETQNNLPNEAE